MAAPTDDLRPYFLLGGLNGKDLWPAIDVVFISYLVLLLAPRWKWTPTLTLVTPTFHAVLYVGSLFSVMLDPKEGAAEIDFTTMEGVVALFRDPDVVFPAWIHYIVFDLLVSRMIVFDSVQRGASSTFHFLAVVPCVLGTCLFGPTGFLTYMILRQIFLPVSSSDSTSEKAKIL